MDQTTQASDTADTPTTTGADVPAGESGNDADDQAVMAAALAELAGNPYVPAVLRDAWPAFMRQAARRESQLADLAAEVQAVHAELRDLVRQLTPGS